MNKSMGAESDPQRLTVTVEEAAELLGIGRNSAYHAVRRGELPAIRVGRRLLVSRTALDHLLEGGPARHDDRSP